MIIVRSSVLIVLAVFTKAWGEENVRSSATVRKAMRRSSVRGLVSNGSLGLQDKIPRVFSWVNTWNHNEKEEKGIDEIWEGVISVLVRPEDERLVPEDS